MKIIQLIIEGKHIWFARGKQLPSYGTRQSSWSELFFDLMFVAGMSILNVQTFSAGLELSLLSFSYYIFSFMSLWLIWMSITFYSNQFEVNSIRHRILLFTNITSVALLSIGVEGYLSTYINLQGSFYLLMFIISRVILKLSWYSMDRSSTMPNILSMTKRLQHIYSITIAINFLLLLYLINVDGLVLLGVSIWGGTLIFEFIALNTLFAHSQQKMTTFHHGHLRERFGLFTMLLLGEIIISALNGFRNNLTLTFENILLLLVIFLFIFLFWWIYYDQIMTFPFRERGKSRMIWTSFHFFFALLCLLLSVSIPHLSSNLQLDFFLYHSFISILVIFFFAITLLHLSLDFDTEETTAVQFKLYKGFHFFNLVWIRLASIAILIVLYFFPINNTLLLFALVCTIFLGNVIAGVIIWLAQRACLASPQD
ncbi:MAG: low temperature requirement protein A [Erysipelotrichaceae bacterium]